MGFRARSGFRPNFPGFLRLSGSFGIFIEVGWARWFCPGAGLRGKEALTVDPLTSCSAGPCDRGNPCLRRPRRGGGLGGRRGCVGPGPYRLAARNHVESCGVRVRSAARSRFRWVAGRVLDRRQVRSGPVRDRRARSPSVPGRQASYGRPMRPIDVARGVCKPSFTSAPAV